MPGPLPHSQAAVCRQLLIDLGVGAYPAVPAPDWPVYLHGGEPDSPDEVITLAATVGVQRGRRMAGDRVSYFGLQARVRAGTDPAAWSKADALCAALDSVDKRHVTVSGTAYLVHSVQRTTDPVVLGKEVLTSKRFVYTVNALVDLKAL